MARYILKRLLLMIPVILGVCILVFTIMYFAPGDPAQVILGGNATKEQYAELREKLGLNRSYFERLFEYMRNVFLRFDFGTSYVSGASVSKEILSRFPRSLLIAFVSMIITLAAGIPLGITAATHRNKAGDYATMLFSLVGVSMPGFWVGQMLQVLFAIYLAILPFGGYTAGHPEFYVLPCVAASIGGIASIARQTRSSMLEVIRADYITTARAKGQTEHAVLYKHALKNALIPVITSAGMSFGITMGGALVIETVFALPGLGMYIVSGINGRDYPVVQGGIIFISIAFSIVMLLVDLVYAFVDPRIKTQYQGEHKKRSKAGKHKTAAAAGGAQ